MVSLTRTDYNVIDSATAVGATSFFQVPQPLCEGDCRLQRRVAVKGRVPIADPEDNVPRLFIDSELVDLLHAISG